MSTSTPIDQPIAPDDEPLNVIISVQRHLKPVHRNAEIFKENSLYPLLHPLKAKQLGAIVASHQERGKEYEEQREKETGKKNSRQDDHRSDELQDSMITDQSQLYIPSIVHDWNNIIGEDTPQISISSEYPRAQTTRNEVLNGQECVRVNEPRILAGGELMKVAMRSGSALPSAGQLLFDILGTTPEVAAQFEKTQAHLREMRRLGEVPTEHDRTISIHVVAHESWPEDAARVALGAEDENLRDIDTGKHPFSHEAPYGGMSVIKLEGLRSPADFTHFQSIERSYENKKSPMRWTEYRWEPPEGGKATFLGFIAPREKMLSMIRGIQDVVRVCSDEAARNELPIPATAPRGSKWTPEVLQQIVADLDVAYTAVSNGDVLPSLYPPFPPKNNDGTITRDQIKAQNALSRLRNIALGIALVDTASQHIDELGEAEREAVERFGADHATVLEKTKMVSNFLDITAADLAKRHAIEIDVRTPGCIPSLQPEEPTAKPIKGQYTASIVRSERDAQRLP